MEVKNYLLGYKNMYIYQDTDSFSFSLDSVLLPNFITINKNIKEILDIGCGNAPIPLILSTKTDANITGVEIQDNEMFNFSLDSVLLPNFVTINKKIDRILDIGCGNAPIPLIL